MKTIGIRASNKAVTYTVYDSSLKQILNIEEIVVPAAFNFPDALKYLRNNLLDILREYQIEKAGIRITEPNAQSINFDRIQIEGVLQEAFASSNLKAYFAGAISKISSKLEIDRKNFKLYVDGSMTWAVEGWSEMKANEREATLTAIGAVNA